MSSTNRVCTFCATASPFLVLMGPNRRPFGGTSTLPHRRTHQVQIGKFLASSDTCALWELLHTISAAHSVYFLALAQVYSAAGRRPPSRSAVSPCTSRPAGGRSARRISGGPW